MTVGDCCFHCCAVPASFNLQAAAELPDSFSHACDAYANRLSPRRMVQHSIRYPLTLVTDRYDDSIGDSAQSLPSPRWLPNEGERL